MSQAPNSKLSFKHQTNNMQHEIIVYDGSGAVFVSHTNRNFDAAFDGAKTLVHAKLQDELKKNAKIPFRDTYKPCERRGDGRMPIDKELWRQMTLSDWNNTFLGLITQSEFARIRNVSRQAINQAIQRGDLEVFNWNNQNYIPFDIVAISPETIDRIGEPMVIFFDESKDTKRPRRKFIKNFNL